MSDLNPLIIVGGGRFVEEIIWLAQETGAWNLAGILTDREALIGGIIRGLPVLGRPAEWARWHQASFVVAVGSPRTRRDLVREMEVTGAPKFATLVHPSVAHGSDLELGPGTLICAGANLTVGITVGAHSIVNLGCSVGHNARFGEFCTLAPLTAISGEVHVGAGVEFGTHAVALPGVRVGSGAVVGAGAVATHDVPDNAIVVGMPARFLRTISPF